MFVCRQQSANVFKNSIHPLFLFVNKNLHKFIIQIFLMIQGIEAVLKCHVSRGQAKPGELKTYGNKTCREGFLSVDTNFYLRKSAFICPVTGKNSCFAGFNGKFSLKP
ncbi:MAG: hypothetical protein LBB83_04100, partial [Treponema sp.]|nr:hypothetical protein [Treponema sp.]